MEESAISRYNCVFINCPFDEEYTKFLYVILFTVWCCGKTPKLTLVNRESSTPRLNRITSMISSSKYGIHDLSRCKASADDFFRMNMPFELGLDIGAKTFSENKDKEIMIIAGKKYDYQKALSDLSGNDPIYYDDDAKILSKEIRNWFYERAENRNDIPTALSIWTSYEDYFGKLQEDFDIIGFNTIKVQAFLDKIPVYINRKI